MNESSRQGAERRAETLPPARDEDMSLLWLLGVMLRERRLLLWFVLGGMVLSLAVGLIRDRTWTTSFSFMPQEGANPASGLASLAGQFGVSLGALAGGAQPPELYADILLTREVLGPLATDTFTTREGERVPLPVLLEVSGATPEIVTEMTLRKLRDDVVSPAIRNRTTGMVGVIVRTTSDRASLEIARRLLAGLQEFNTVTRQSQGRAEREFTERRLEESRTALRQAEGQLETFLDRNRILASSPSLTFERDRLQREVTFQQQMYTALAQLYEEARLKEVRDTPVITMIEAPVLAARADSRLLAVTLLVGTIAALFAGMLVALAREAWSRERLRGRDPGLALISTEWESMRGRVGTKTPG